MLTRRQPRSRSKRDRQAVLGGGAERSLPKRVAICLGCAIFFEDRTISTKFESPKSNLLAISSVITKHEGYGLIADHVVISAFVVYVAWCTSLIDSPILLA